MKIIKKLLISVISISLAGVFLFINGCFLKYDYASAKVSYDKIPYDAANEAMLSSELENDAFLAFSSDLLSYVKDGDNGLLSPYSAYMALALTINGASGDTLSQMEQVLGLSRDKINIFAANLYSKYVEKSTFNDYILTADSVWSNATEKAPLKSFLETICKYYGTEVYSLDFSQNETLKAINDWIATKTNGRIKDMLNSIPSDALMYLINTLFFKSDWTEQYVLAQKGLSFSSLSGSKNNVDCFSASTRTYYSTNDFDGFSLPYKAPGISFIGMLPKKGNVDPASLLNKDRLKEFISSRSAANVSVKIPCFNYDYEAVLTTFYSASNRMPLAFNKQLANFSEMYDLSEFNVYISKVFQKTTIKLDNFGTSAAAATYVEMSKTTSVGPTSEIRIELNRPFVYMILDEASNIPLFIGKVNSL